MITGAAKGMGRQTAIDMAGEGATVVIADIDEAALAKTVAHIESRGGKGFGQLCDVARRAQVDSLINQTYEKHGALHILINNAGILIPGTIEETVET